jgi:hypothetical protein
VQPKPQTQLSEGPWIGGLQLPSSSEPSGGWTWNEPESWTPAPWASGQPDDSAGPSRVHFSAALGQRSATWGDADKSARMPGYVVEFSGSFVPRSIGLLREEAERSPGYTLIAPLSSRFVHLIDERGRSVHRWQSQDLAGVVTYLLPNGNLLRTANPQIGSFPGGQGGVVQELDWDSNVVWSYQQASSTEALHHDVVRMPNGNFLMLLWEVKTNAEALAAGRDPAKLADGDLVIDAIVEVAPTGPRSGQVVWKWSVWDHLVQDFDANKANFGDVAQHPGRADLNWDTVDGDRDWTHANALAYNPYLDQIAISVRHFSEIWILDHSTTTAEAKTGSGGRSGKGGRILYRWGNPQTYRAGTTQDQVLAWQHDCTWIPGATPGTWHMMVFNNGNRRPTGLYSSVDEWILPTPNANGVYPKQANAPYGPSQLHWQYTAPQKFDFYSAFTSNAQRLPNGNTLICSGVPGTVFEVTPSGERLWEYQIPLTGTTYYAQGTPTSQTVPFTFRSYRYAPDYSGLIGRSLSPGEPLESYERSLWIEGSTLPLYRDIGATVEMTLKSAPQDAGKIYLLATAYTQAPIQMGYRFWRVGFDPFFALSLSDSLTFQGYVGAISTTGTNTARLPLPPLAWLRGLDLFTAGVVFDQAARAGIGWMTNQVELRVRR